MVEPDHPDMEKRETVGEGAGPGMDERAAEFPGLDYRAMDFDREQGDDDRKHGIAERFNVRAFGKAKFLPLRVLLHHARSFGPVGEEDIGYRPTCVF
jgi:hypothetical protein